MKNVQIDCDQFLVKIYIYKERPKSKYYILFLKNITLSYILRVSLKSKY